jgi:DNA-binding NtrC family response regulator
VYGIVKQNHGEIMVYSEPGKGTSFKIYLPQVEVAEEASTGGRQAAQVRGHETILLCEDEEGIRKLVRQILARQGYRVLEADTPGKAIDLARQDSEPIHLLLTDLVMPRMTGVELARSIQELRPEIKVIYMSGYSDNHLSAGWVLTPDTVFIQKPFSASDLGQKLREVLSTSSSA